MKVKLKHQKNLEHQVKWQPSKLVLHSILQTFKIKTIQIPIWQLNKQIISTHFVYLFSAHIRAWTKIISLEFSNQAMK